MCSVCPCLHLSVSVVLRFRTNCSETYEQTICRYLGKKVTTKYSRVYGYPYLRDGSAIKNVHVSNAFRTTHPETQLETLVCVLVLVAMRFALWTMMAELSFSVDGFIFSIFSAIQQQSPQANATATGTVAAGQQRPRAPTTPAGTVPSR